MTLETLNDITDEHDQWCPLLPWGTDGGTVGGCVATSRRGPASKTLGAPRDLMLGLTFVDGRNAVVTAGGRVVKNVAGFDLTRLLVGSWGTLGIVTAASLRLRARPPASETWSAPARAVAHDALRSLMSGAHTPIACAQIDARAASGLGLAPEPAVVVWLAGGVEHVRAASAAARAIGFANEQPESFWRALRASRPFAHGGTAAPLSPTLARLNARVRDQFDPDRVFAAPPFFPEPLVQR
jgi:glycolate oxidase FAD binding subunit